MNRDRQIELIVSAEERIHGYLRTWMKLPAFAAAIRSPNPERPETASSHRTMRKRAC